MADWETTLRQGLHEAVDDWAPEPGVRRAARPPRVRVFAAAAGLVLVAGIAAALAAGSFSPRSVTALNAALPTCGQLPSQTRTDLTGTLQVMAGGPSGSTVPASVVITASGAKPVDIISERSSRVAVFRDGRLVGGSQSNQLGLDLLMGFPDSVSASRPVTFPGQVQLFSCVPAAGLLNRPLPPGRYELVGVANLGSSDNFLRTAPVPFTVTAALATCGTPPASTSRSLLRATLTVAGATRSGAAVSVTMSIAPRTGSADVDTGQPADVAIVQNGHVVGRYEGLVGGTGVGARGVTAAKPLVLPPTSVLLSGCPSGTVDGAHPDDSRKPLPAGDYELVATADGGIVSDPLPIVITT